MFSLSSLKKGLCSVLLVMKNTTVYLEERHREWLDRKAVNFSKFARNKIDAEIAKEGEVAKRFIVEEWLADKRDIPEEIEGVEIKSTNKAILVDPIDGLSEKVWLPKSQLEKVESIGPYEEEVEHP